MIYRIVIGDRVFGIPESWTSWVSADYAFEQRPDGSIWFTDRARTRPWQCATPAVIMPGKTKRRSDRPRASARRWFSKYDLQRPAGPVEAR